MCVLIGTNTVSAGSFKKSTVSNDTLYESYGFDNQGTSMTIVGDGELTVIGAGIEDTNVALETDNECFTSKGFNTSSEDPVTINMASRGKVIAQGGDVTTNVGANSYGFGDKLNMKGGTLIAKAGNVSGGSFACNTIGLYSYGDDTEAGTSVTGGVIEASNTTIHVLVDSDYNGGCILSGAAEPVTMVLKGVAKKDPLTIDLSGSNTLIAEGSCVDGCVINLSGDLTFTQESGYGTLTVDGTGLTASSGNYGIYVKGNLTNNVSLTVKGGVASAADDEYVWTYGIYCTGSFTNNGSLTVTAGDITSGYLGRTYAIYCGGGFTNTSNNMISLTSGISSTEISASYAIYAASDIVFKSGTLYATNGNSGESAYGVFTYGKIYAKYAVVQSAKETFVSGTTSTLTPNSTMSPVYLKFPPVFDPCNGEDVIISDTLPDDPTWEGYIFDGWYDSYLGAYETRYYNGKGYYSSGSEMWYPWLDDGKIYYARWKVATDGNYVLTDDLYVYSDRVCIGKDEYVPTEEGLASLGITFTPGTPAKLTLNGAVFLGRVECIDSVIICSGDNDAVLELRKPLLLGTNGGNKEFVISGNETTETALTIKPRLTDQINTFRPIAIRSGNTLTLEDGATLTGSRFTIADMKSAGGAMLNVADGAVFYMNGGTISDCSTVSDTYDSTFSRGGRGGGFRRSRIHLLQSGSGQLPD